MKYPDSRTASLASAPYPISTLSGLAAKCALPVQRATRKPRPPSGRHRRAPSKWFHSASAPKRAGDRCPPSRRRPPKAVVRLRSSPHCSQCRCAIFPAPSRPPPGGSESDPTIHLAASRSYDCRTAFPAASLARQQAGKPP